MCTSVRGAALERCNPCVGRARAQVPGENARLRGRAILTYCRTSPVWCECDATTHNFMRHTSMMHRRLHSSIGLHTGLTRSASISTEQRSSTEPHQAATKQRRRSRASASRVPDSSRARGEHGRQVRFRPAVRRPEGLRRGEIALEIEHILPSHSYHPLGRDRARPSGVTLSSKPTSMRTR